MLIEATSTGTSNLELEAVRTADAGEYVCMVENEWGAQVTSRSAILQVAIPGNRTYFTTQCTNCFL